MDEPRKVYLFGGPRPWSSTEWTSSDDRVRGGSSYSALVSSDSAHTATFKGNLDIQTLGGAGFASQRTVGDRCWDLCGYDGLELLTAESDGKLYTLTVKDEIPPKRPDGRDESTIVWESDFRLSGNETVTLKWEDFRATYRGKEVKDAKPLNLKNIRRISIMMRSFFGTQQGDFSLGLKCIAAVGSKGDKAWDEGVVTVTACDDASSSAPGRGCCVIL